MSAGQMLDQALAAEQQAYRAQLRGEPASAAYAAARDAYLASHAQTGPRSWGRLIGALKMAILAGDGVGPVALRALDENEDEPGASAAYAGALAAVALGRRPRVREMLDAGDAFARTGRALAALGDAYAAALEEIVADFAARDRHLSGVPVADTAMVLERLAEPLGMAARPPTPLIPPSIYCDRTGL